ncbi:MAG: gephyrin-like molybdotransferase Glp [Solirubrobacterales bacterium]
MVSVIDIAQHLARIIEAVEPLPVMTVPIADSPGRCLTEPVDARFEVPPWTNSAMDGYALRHADLIGNSESGAVTLRVVGEVAAGSSNDPALGPMEAVRIMTGAPLPSDADTVVPQEMTDLGTETVTITGEVNRGRHVRPAGEDKKVGDPIVASGLRITPEMVAAIVSAGHGTVEVAALPRVSVIATGSELSAPGESLSRGMIPDSNSLTITSLVVADGSEMVHAERVGDGRDDLQQAIERVSADSDVIILTGGVSVGEHDPVKALFSSGSDITFDRVAMQPGKPQAFGRLPDGGPLLFGLPGNPVSAWVSFHMFVQPALRQMQGYRQCFPQTVEARVTAPWNAPVGRTQIIPVRLEDTDSGRTVSPASAGGSGSHLVASLAGANGYAIVDAEIDGLAPDDLVPTVRITDPGQYSGPDPETTRKQGDGT